MGKDEYSKSKTLEFFLNIGIFIIFIHFFINFKTKSKHFSRKKTLFSDPIKKSWTILWKKIIKNSNLSFEKQIYNLTNIGYNKRSQASGLIRIYCIKLFNRIKKYMKSNFTIWFIFIKNLNIIRKFMDQNKILNMIRI